jgi:Icc-related predicted phosphoesterase
MVFRRGSRTDPGEPSPPSSLRIAAAADLHCLPETAAHTREAFAAIAKQADMILLAGDLTSHGQPDQAQVLADAVSDIDLPIVACMGNHDMHYERMAELVPIWEQAGITVLEREHTICDVAGHSVGIVGLKGFVGGYGDASMADYGEPLMRELFAMTTVDVDDLDAGLEAIGDCELRLVLMHYSPVADTLVGEPEGLWSMLGSDRFAAPIRKHRPDMVLHGHAHSGTFAGALEETPVYNVSIPVMRRDFWIFELGVGDGR